MIPGIQLLGIIFAAIMIYLTYVYYKRNNYGLKSLILWLLVWAGVLFILMFPKTIYGLMQVLEIDRTADFFVLGGFTFFSIVIFYLYVVVKKNEQKIEALVRKIAIEKDAVRAKSSSAVSHRETEKRTK